MPATLAAAEILEFETAMVIVLAVAVVILAGAVAQLRRELRSLGRSAPLEHRPETHPGVPASPDELVAIIAAVDVALGANHRLLSVHPVETLWSREGRRSHFGSHAVR